MMWEHRNLTLRIVRMLLSCILRWITALWCGEHRLPTILRLWGLLNRALHRLLHGTHYSLLWLWRHLSGCCLRLYSLLCRLRYHILWLCHLWSRCRSLFHHLEERSLVHRLLLCGNLLVYLLLLVGSGIHTSLLECGDGILMILGCDKFLSLLHMLLVLLTLLLLLFGFLGFGILCRLAVGSSLICLLLELHQIGDKPRSLAYRLHYVLQELCIHLFGSAR